MIRPLQVSASGEKASQPHVSSTEMSARGSSLDDSSLRITCSKLGTLVQRLTDIGSALGL